MKTKTIESLSTGLLAFAVLILGLTCLVKVTEAGELKYAPTNPSFGGNPFNSSHLLGTAEAQKDFEAPSRERPPAEQFADDIQRSLFSAISREISDAILGEDARESGNFTVGDTRVDFQRKGDQVVVDVFDDKTGGQTTIELPVPRF